MYVMYLWDNFKKITCITGCRMRKQWNKGRIHSWRKNVIKLRKEQWMPGPRSTENKENKSRQIPMHIVLKMAKVNDKKIILKASRERQTFISEGTLTRLSANFLRKFYKKIRK